MNAEEIVDLTCLTPRTETEDKSPQLSQDADGGTISLLTPEMDSGKRRFERCPLEDGSPSPRQAEKKFKEADAGCDAVMDLRDLKPDSKTKTFDKPQLDRSGTLEHAILDIQLPAAQLFPTEPPSGSPVQKLDGTSGLHPKHKSMDVPQRRQLFSGDDEIVVEICHETEQSPMRMALIQKLDDIKKQKQPFCCHVHQNSLLPGRKCISWLQKIKKKTHTQATHEYIPYLVILLEVESLVMVCYNTVFREMNL